MRQTEFGNFNHRVEVIGQDELTDLARTFNRLLARLQEKIEEATEYRILQQEAVLSALQSQINSHFLYNAMESINSLSHVRDQPDIAFRLCAVRRLEEGAHQLFKGMRGARDEQSTKLIAEMAAFISLHYTEKLDLQKIADHVGISKNYMSSLFKQEMNTTVLNYIVDL